MPLANAQIIELFHVALLDALSHSLDPTRFVLKGGANLRYFFGSTRYSEDIDLDIAPMPVWHLERKVDAVLDSPQLEIILRPSGLEVAEVSKPKQTETTQRWKVGIRDPGRARLARSKIEFSKRGGDDRYRLDAVPKATVEPYGLRPPAIQHYIDDAATEQKVLALAGRAQTQARDVFDLDLLLRRGNLAGDRIERQTLTTAADRALELSFEEFRQQVVDYLEPGAAELYDSPAAWEQMQTTVAERLADAR